MARRRPTALSSRGLRPRSVLVGVAAAAAALALGACGNDDFENEPRPPLPFDVSVKISDDNLVVSPAEFGAGIATFTVVNLSDEPAVLAIDGPTAGETDEIAAGTTAVLKTEITTGDYTAEVEGGSLEPFRFEVTEKRESAQNELLLP